MNSGKSCAEDVQCGGWQMIRIDPWCPENVRPSYESKSTQQSLFEGWGWGLTHFLSPSIMKLITNFDRCSGGNVVLSREEWIVLPAYYLVIFFPPRLAQPGWVLAPLWMLRFRCWASTSRSYMTEKGPHRPCVLKRVPYLLRSFSRWWLKWFIIFG